ncbi:MAG: prepilin-type N-terminal cleavage/methylation domain-containing protein [Candidatus Omnitrophica bacterium]|nr:prepilin-type N-terminal cleavage/methylation domain-containing protein [Candidatus Omnitrophota bacterium]
MNKKGFTLIELVMVIVIIGILAGIAIPKFVSLVTEAKKSATRGGLGAIRSAVAIQYAQNATNPSATDYFPSQITTSMFADGVIPTNQLTNKTAINNVDNTVSGTTESTTYGWWYVTTGTSKGRVGAYTSTSTVDTGDW